MIVLRKKIAMCKCNLDSKWRRIRVSKHETRDVQPRLGDERRTEIQAAAEELSVEDLIAE